MTVIWAIATVVINELLRRKDFYVLFILTALITLLMGSINLFDDRNIVRCLKEICLLLVWLSSLVIAISTTARQIPAEREQRTIFPLLAKPVSRGQLIAGKFLGCWLACGVALLVFYLFFGLISASREHEWPLANYFQAVVLHWCALAILIAITLLGSIVFAAPSSNGTIVFVVAVGNLFIARHLNKVALQMHEPSRTILSLIYFAIPYLELFDVRDLIIHNLPSVPWLIWAAALLYAAGYTAFFLVAAWLMFRRRALN